MNVGDHVRAGSIRRDHYAKRTIAKGTRGVIAELIDYEDVYVDWKIDGQIIRGHWTATFLEPVPALILLAETVE